MVRDYKVVFPVAGGLISAIILMLRCAARWSHRWYLMAAVGLGFAATSAHR